MTRPGTSKQSAHERAKRKGEFTLDARRAGILLHVTSLPGPHGNGDVGPAARRFVDFLSTAGQGWWQMLPVNPAGAGNSPYSGVSAFGGNPLLISLDDLVEQGLLHSSDINFSLNPARADYDQARPLRTAALRKAFVNHLRRPRRLARPLERFRHEAAYWLPDYTAFMALRDAQGGKLWTEWPRELRQRAPGVLARARKELAREIAYYELEQLLFHEQWARLRAYAAARGVGLIGDAPIFIAHDSADVWSHATSFLLDRSGSPTHVAGVPPDYFCKTGQLWGNPLYRWRALQRAGFHWWVERLRTLLRSFDVVRLDHFVGFTRYWEVPASHTTAEHGRWQSALGPALFRALQKALGKTPFIAEDLGEVTPAVRALRDAFGMPGMRVLQFAFGNDSQSAQFLPHCYIPGTVAYSGTHDNDTFAGWFSDPGDADGSRSPRQAAKERRAAIAYLAGPPARELAEEAHWAAIRVLYASVARTVIIPMQDVLGLGNEARINRPGTAEGNWQWRLGNRQATGQLARKLRAFSDTYNRTAGAATPRSTK